MTLDELRRAEREKAAARGHTLEEELDRMEGLTRCKEYVDGLRELYGVAVSPTPAP